MNHEENRQSNTGKISDRSLCDCMVSVSCLAFNHERYIRKALEGFVNQETDFRYEILIHDDASTDSTADIIREYEAKYPELIRPVYESENQYSAGISNISGVYNFPRAKGRYIAMCEGDDYWSDTRKLQKQFDFMESHPDYSLCCHPAGIVSEDGAFRTQSLIHPFSGTREIAPGELISKKTNVPTASLFFKTEYAKSLPQWYFDCPVGDIPLQLWLLTRGRVYYMDEIMSMYRAGREGSWGDMMDSEGRSRITARWESHYEAMKRLYASFDGDTGQKWHDFTDEALRRLRFEIDLKEGNAAAVLDDGNALFINELPPTEACLQKLKARAPWAYALLRKIYLYVR